jgi:hypothetical protein
VVLAQLLKDAQNVRIENILMRHLAGGDTLRHGTVLGLRKLTDGQLDRDLQCDYLTTA